MGATGGAECYFCGAPDPQRTHANLYHPFKPDHGPFEFHQCHACGSGLTISPPSQERLAALYASYRDGLPDLHREIMSDDPQFELYELCAKRMIAAAPRLQGASWIDVGAGGGELSRILSGLIPDGKGLAVDLHARPGSLSAYPQVEWIQADINDPAFADGVDRRADFVISTAVWEHVVRPDLYARNLIRLLKPGGVLYLMCPNYGSFARHALGRRWPYFTPGEHLNMPTLRGASACLDRAWAMVHATGPKPAVVSRRLALPYSLRYVFRRFGIDAIGRMLPPGLGFPLPSGALESVLKAPA